jgi:two-component system, LytTR family, sensor kinase
MSPMNDKWLRILGIPMAAVIPALLFSDALGNSKIGFFEIYKYAFVEVWLIWESCRQVVIKARKHFPELNQTTSRLIFQFFWCSIVAVILQSFYSLIPDYWHIWGINYTFEEHISNVLIGFFFLVPILGIYETVYFYRKWREKMEETAKLKKEQVELQFDLLKSQINPHFLFNSLNTLSSLIHDKPLQANAFLEELATVYRYLLRNNNKELCTVREEIIFIIAYFHLLKTRYAEMIKLNILVDRKHFFKQIPSLSLQLLVENAVKHNIVSVSKPLNISIFYENNFLFVENNLQKKKNQISSNHIGLDNIISKYELLGKSNIEIICTDCLFKVGLPLIDE